MYRGSKQGGGGNQFVDLTGMFKTKKGTGYSGFVKPEQFDAIRNVLDACEAAGVDLMFYFGSPREGDKADGRLSMTPSSRPAGGSSGGSGSRTPTRKRVAQAPQVSAPRADGNRQNPPKDPLDKFLEDFQN